MRIPALTDVAHILSTFSIFQTLLPDDGIRNHISQELISEPPELPGGSPFSLCKASSSTDLFNISSVEITHQPIYMYDSLSIKIIPSFLTSNRDDVFSIHVYGSFQNTFTSNATIDLTVDCGSHCDMYGVPPDERAGETGSFNFCDLTEIEQPTGGEKRNDTCNPKQGYALISSEAYIFPMFIRAPVCFLRLIHTFMRAER
jgi:hypothetical protein